MSERISLLHALRASTADLLQALDGVQWSDADVEAPSLCRGWTRGHVLTHLARNADGIAETLKGALNGEVVARYPDGWDARNADIEAGAKRPATTIIADVRESAQRLDRVLGAVQDADAWEAPTDEGRPAEHWLFARWKEVEVHRVDLAGEYTPRHWPAQLVAALLPKAAQDLADRAPGALRVVVTEEGSASTDLVGRTWTAGEGAAPTEVAGPDWAVLAWLTGRGDVVRDALPDQPELADWQ